MLNRALRILQVSTYDTNGGAEKVASNLFQSYRAGGYGSWLAVGHKLGIDPDVRLFRITKDAEGNIVYFLKGIRARTVTHTAGRHRLMAERFCRCDS